MSIPRAFIKASVALALTSVTFFTTSASGQSPAPLPNSTASDQNPTAAGSRSVRTVDTHRRRQIQQLLPHSSHPLPHHRQTTIAIEMESSSGKLPQTPRCLSC